MDSLTLAISQGSLRRGSAAVYIDVHHPEIEEFLEIRKPSGDFNRKSLNLHHGINITDEFMEAVRDGRLFACARPKNERSDSRSRRAQAVDQDPGAAPADRRALHHLLRHRERARCRATSKKLGLKVRQSNLCSEIMLHTGLDHQGRERTAVCCLSSLNAEKFLEWREPPKASSKTCSASSITCCRISSTARPKKWSARATPPTANAAWALA